MKERIMEILSELEREGLHGEAKQINNIIGELSVSAAPINTVDELIAALTEAISNTFPKSFVDVSFSERLGKDVTIRFALGKDKSEFPNGYIENDPAKQIIMVAYDQINDDNTLFDKINVKMVQGDNIAVPSKVPHLAFERIKVGFRKRTDTPERIVQYIDNYFQKLKQVLIENVDQMENPEFVKSKL